jgi:hypothetical protein
MTYVNPSWEKTPSPPGGGDRAQLPASIRLELLEALGARSADAAHAAQMRPARRGAPREPAARARSGAGRRRGDAQEPRDVLGEDVDLDVHSLPGGGESKRGARQRLGYERDLEAVVAQSADGQADAA